MDEGGDSAISKSPKEDYDPLSDDILPRFDDAADVEQSNYYECGDGYEPLNSIDLEEQAYQNSLKYCITPPIRQRDARREKEKHARSVRKCKMIPRTVNFIKETYNDPLSGATVVDSDDNMVSEENYIELRDRKKKKKEDGKRVTASRAQDRSMKRNSGDFSAHEPLKLSISNPVPSKAPPIDPHVMADNTISSRTRLLSISSKPRMTNKRHAKIIEPGDTDIPNEYGYGNCPENRIKFFRDFSITISLGSQQKKESKEKPSIPSSNYGRQVSMEQEKWDNAFFDLLWLELQAWRNGKTLQEHDADVYRKRYEVGKILDEIMTFNLSSQNCANFSGSTQNGPTSPHVEALAFRTVTLTEETILCQKMAINRVTEILFKLEECENLYPTSKALAKASDLYCSDAFTCRVKSLNLWLKITRDICQKLKSLGKALGVDKISGVKWPFLDYEIPSVNLRPISLTFGERSIPEINEPTNEHSDSESPIASTVSSPEIHTQKSPLITRKVQFQMSDSETSSRADTPVFGLDEANESWSPIMKSPPIRSLICSQFGSDVNLDDFTKNSIYRPFVETTLKKMGMQKLVTRLHESLNPLLQRAKMALEKQEADQSLPTEALSEHSEQNEDLQSSQHLSEPIPAQLKHSSSSSEFGVWSTHFLAMGLPSFRPSYLFLARIPLDVIHECLRLRLEQRPKGDSSFHSILQLKHECKELLRVATNVKQYYQLMVSVVLWDDATCEEKVGTDMELFETDLKDILEVYFGYLQTWMSKLQNQLHVSRHLKNALDNEWKFTKQICRHVVGGETEAGKRFSTLASSFLGSIADFLDSGIDDCTNSLINLTMDGDDISMDNDRDMAFPIDYYPEGQAPSDGSADSLLNEQGKRNEDSNASQESSSGDSDDADDEEEDVVDEAQCAAQKLRQSIQQMFRDFKDLFREARERASKALGFAKTLRQELEIAADFRICVSTRLLLTKLLTMNHVEVIVPNNFNTGYLMFIPKCLISNKMLILQLLNVTCGRQTNNEVTIPDKGPCYLLLVNCSGGADCVDECPIWNGENVQVEPTAETSIALSHIQVSGLMLVVTHSLHLAAERRKFDVMMENCVELINEQTSCHQAIAEALAELKMVALEVRDKVSHAINQADEKLNYYQGQTNENEQSHMFKQYRETMHQCYNFGFEYHKDVTRLITGEGREQLCHSLVSFAKEWMQFVMEKCERGRGLRPRWASNGLDFLPIACEPRTLAYLSEEEFEDLKEKINLCVNHVIGTPTLERPQPSSPNVELLNQARNYYQRGTSMYEYRQIIRSVSARSTYSEPDMVPENRLHRSSVDLLTTDCFASVHDDDDREITKRRQKKRATSVDPIMLSGSSSSSVQSNPVGFSPTNMAEAIKRIEYLQQKKLTDKRLIGRPVSNREDANKQIKIRRVKFRWQRGLKIGEGQFGKVYTAINSQTGEMMAMKEIKLQPNDHKAFKETADEIKIFESIVHPRLVKYYGVEVYRDEMLIFMEYCTLGTIEEAARGGLSEYHVKKYTRDILEGVNVLHDAGIVHRDIKGANIFLTVDGCVKLGDFGCSIKLKNLSTMPGEFNTLVGTTAFIAPEVIISNTGHGRAADIWSVGCVVIEMVTGKRPWHELENMHQIMYKVGMGNSPAIPETLSEEGKDFLSHCFEHDPENRWTASELRDHRFAKVYDELESDSLKSSQQPFSTTRLVSRD